MKTDGTKWLNADFERMITPPDVPHLKTLFTSKTVRVTSNIVKHSLL